MRKQLNNFTKTTVGLLLVLLIRQQAVLAQELLDVTIMGETWASVKANQEGRLILLYYKSRPFNYMDDYARQTGIDYEMVNLFISFLKRKYNVNIEPIWIELSNYEELAAYFPNVKNGTIGMPAMSATPDMGQIALLSLPYMHNNLVVVTHPSIRQAASEAALKAALKEATAYYVENTVAYDELQKLNSAAKTVAVKNSEALADAIAATENSYAIMPLYDYFVAVKRGLEVNRQKFLEVPQADVSWWLPRQSDWAEPLTEFFTHENFKANASLLVKRHCTIDAEELTLQQSNRAQQEQTGEEQPTGVFEFKTTNSHLWFALIVLAIVVVLVVANRSIAASRKKAAEELAMRKKAMK
ncbi:hypothetical protein [Rhodoflexus sp.]